jgi:hypothetical protein
MTDQPNEDLTQQQEDWMPGLEVAPGLDADEYEIDPEDADLPVIDIDTLPETNPSEAEDVEVQDDMDDSALEGLGADGQQICRRAVPRVREKVRNGESNKIGYCLQEIRIVNETPAKYLDAIQSLIAADVKHRITDWSQVPRGTIGYFRGDPNTHPHGHVFENFGGEAWIGTTDSPLGKWGRVKGYELLERWGYEDAFWSPFVNDNRVWRPQHVHEDPPPTPQARRIARLVAWRDELERRHQARVHAHDMQRAHELEGRIRVLTRLIEAAKEK